MLKHSSHLTYLALALFGLAAGTVVDAQDETPPSAKPSEIEKEIQATADSFIAAFKKRDAPAIADHWASDGVYTDEDGQRFSPFLQRQ